MTEENLKVEQFGFKTDRCKFCGKKIVWSRNVDNNGQPIPLDPKAPVFRVIAYDDGKGKSSCYQVKEDKQSVNKIITLVSHFSTCAAKTKAWQLLRELWMMTDKIDEDIDSRIREYLRWPVDVKKGDK